MREKQGAPRKEKERQQTRTTAQAKERNTKPQPTCTETGPMWRPIWPKAAALIRQDKASNTNLIREKER